jgi:hypothetical protein
MGHLPRKLSEGKVIGWVYCKYLDSFPCEDDDDKRKIIAYCQLVKKAIKEGRMIFHPTKIGLEFNDPEKEERDAYRILYSHQMRKNLDLCFTFHKQIKKIVKKSGRSEDIIYIPINKISLD